MQTIKNITAAFQEVDDDNVVLNIKIGFTKEELQAWSRRFSPSKDIIGNVELPNEGKLIELTNGG